jgi:phage terminase large subunit-like protein
LNIASLNFSEKLELMHQLEELERIRSGKRIDELYPETGKLARSKYKKHMRFFELGETCNTRGFIAANRVGKTYGVGGYELTMHLTGQYPEWWPGAMFDSPVRAWAAGDTRKTTKEILQQKLLGDYGAFGTSLIPRDCILKWTPMPGVPEGVETLWIKHFNDGVEDGRSQLVFKSFDQGRKAFQGTEQDVILLDEESDEGIRNECATRLMTTNGLLMETFTPLKGMTPVVLSYMPNGYEGEQTEMVADGKALVMAGWDDVPHLDEAAKAKLLADTPPHLRDARSKGIPSLGAGAIYPVPESEFVVDNFEIPDFWPRAYGLDVGWNRTAGIFGAIDRERDILYLYHEHYRGQAEPPIHAAALRAPGAWIPGVIDPAARGRGQDDGKQLLKMYVDLGLKLKLADNQVEAGIYEVWQRLSTGRLKVCKSLKNWLTEYRMYRRDEKGKIIKDNDHLMDATRYLTMSGMKIAKVKQPGATIGPGFTPLDKGMGL